MAPPGFGPPPGSWPPPRTLGPHPGLCQQRSQQAHCLSSARCIAWVSGMMMFMEQRVGGRAGGRPPRQAPSIHGATNLCRPQSLPSGLFPLTLWPLPPGLFPFPYFPRVPTLWSLIPSGPFPLRVPTIPLHMYRNCAGVRRTSPSPGDKRHNHLPGCLPLRRVPPPHGGRDRRTVVWDCGHRQSALLIAPWLPSPLLLANPCIRRGAGVRVGCSCMLRPSSKSPAHLPCGHAGPVPSYASPMRPCGARPMHPGGSRFRPRSRKALSPGDFGPC